jgi:hypothetical protein
MPVAESKRLGLAAAYVSWAVLSGGSMTLKTRLGWSLIGPVRRRVEIALMVQRTRRWALAGGERAGGP